MDHLLDVMIPGQKIFAVFGFCDIRRFNDQTGLSSPTRWRIGQFFRKQIRFVPQRINSRNLQMFVQNCAYDIHILKGLMHVFIPECLQTEVMQYVNQVAEIVHERCAFRFSKSLYQTR